MERCEKLQDPSIANFVVSVGLAIGIVASYVPQHVRIIRRKTSEGLSPWFLLLGVLSGMCAVCNIFLLARPVFGCCKFISAGSCVASTMGLVQISLQFIMAAMILVLVLIFARDQPFENDGDFAKIQLVGQLCLISFGFSVLASLYVFFMVPSHIIALANLFGIAGALLAVVQYFPQIYTTATLKHAGTLSIPMMCIQTPGGFLWAASLAQREGTSWSSWIPYFTAATLQGIVLVLALYFEKVNPASPQLNHDEVDPAFHESMDNSSSSSNRVTDDSEQAPLLR